MIRLSKSCIGAEEKQAVINVLDKEYLGMGAEVLEFEKLLNNYFEREVICVSTGTSALHLALQAVGIGKGDEVLVQSLTYLASFQAISATGAKPVPCDIDINNLCIDVKDCETKITKRTKAIMPVHYSGGVGRLKDIYKFAKDNNLRVIEDAAHAFGTTYNEKLIGSFGDIACFSFDGIKNITSGEGGCITTLDRSVIDNAKDARLLGVKKDSEKRYINDRSWDFDVDDQGWRYHMSNLMAAIGIEQFKKFDQIKEKRRSLAIHYEKNLKNIKQVKTLNYNYKKIVPHIFVIILEDGLNRNDFIKYLYKLKIQAGIHYAPNHKLTKFYSSDKLSNTDNISGRIVSLPLHCDLELKDIDYITKCINNFK